MMRYRNWIAEQGPRIAVQKVGSSMGEMTENFGELVAVVTVSSDISYKNEKERKYLTNQRR